MFTNNHIKLDSVDSTNSFILSLQQTDVFREGLVVSANYQTSGNGQMGKSWISNTNENILLSLLLEPMISVSNNFVISKIVSLAICDLLIRYGVYPKIKWPNDILVLNYKIAGLLIQNKLKGDLITHSIIGIGLNVNQIVFPKFLTQATSLSLELNYQLNLNQIQLELLKCLSYRFKLFRNGSCFNNEFDKFLFLKDKLAFFEIKNKEVSGVVKGVGKDGRILVLLEDNRIYKYSNKEIKLLL